MGTKAYLCGSCRALNEFEESVVDKRCSQCGYSKMIPVTENVTYDVRHWLTQVRASVKGLECELNHPVVSQVNVQFWSDHIKKELTELENVIDEKFCTDRCCGVHRPETRTSD